MKKSWLSNKTILISGASGGLGFSIAKRLIEKYDCNIIGIARNEEKIKKSIELLGEKKNRFSYYIFDVSIKENWEKLSIKLKDEGKNIDILLNNAGFMLPFSKFEKYSVDEIEEIIKTDFDAYVYSSKYLLTILKQSKTPAIINVSSAAGMCPVVGESMYCAVKYAVRGFTETLNLEYGKKFYIAGIYPGFIKTNILNRMSVKDKENKLIQKLMMPLNKASKKIVNSIAKRKRRIVLGFDGKLMTFFYRLFPRLTPKIIRSVLKKSKLELFNNVFNEEI
ncbi:MAG: SDR family NAD(P)-dependent oxidoreductase [Clostridia bacterium]|nr:SDR family NAD(P)-dependent oxidoreductase [Clostridia bacterium]